MTDKQWEKLIKKTRAAAEHYKKLLTLAEEEYKTRYGHYPSEVDDDWWIDTLHQCSGTTNLEQIKESAQHHKDKGRYS